MGQRQKCNDESNVLLDNVEEGRPWGWKKTLRKEPRFGDENLVIIDDDEQSSASLVEIVSSCCCRTPHEWTQIVLSLIALAASIYFILFSFEMLGIGAQVLAGCQAATLFTGTLDPLANVMIGILATVLIQSSSQTTSIVVSLVQVDAISVSEAIYIVMGCNVGTTMTSTLASLAHIRNFEEMERAFTAGTVHDMFNVLTVLVLFPLELATGYLEKLTGAFVNGAETGHRTTEWLGPIKRFVQPLVYRIIISNKKAIQAVALGATCDSLYPIHCDPDLEPSYSSCHTALIGCDKETNRCPLFFHESATRSQDQIAGGVCMMIATIVLFCSLLGLVRSVQSLLRGMSTKVVYTLTNCNGYFGIVCGCALTLLVQSSSIATSILVPFAGVGALRTHQMYPLVLGCNIGTAISAVIRALSIIGRHPLQVALAHLFFNVTGVVIYYPLPFLRIIPIWVARRLGRGAFLWRYFSFVYLAVLFILLPMFFLGLSVLFHHGDVQQNIAGAFITVISFIGLAWLTIWCKFYGGDMKYVRLLERKTKRKLTDDGELKPEAKARIEPSIKQSAKATLKPSIRLSDDMEETSNHNRESKTGRTTAHTRDSNALTMIGRKSESSASF